MGINNFDKIEKVKELKLKNKELKNKLDFQKKLNSESYNRCNKLMSEIEVLKKELEKSVMLCREKSNLLDDFAKKSKEEISSFKKEFDRFNKLVSKHEKTN